MCVYVYKKQRITTLRAKTQHNTQPRKRKGHERFERIFFLAFFRNFFLGTETDFVFFGKETALSSGGALERHKRFLGDGEGSGEDLAAPVSTRGIHEENCAAREA